MKHSFVLAFLALAGHCQAGDLWEVRSTSLGPEGKPVPYTQTSCFPAGGVMDPAQVLGTLGSCVFDRKNGNASAMSFELTCKTPGMPADLGSMKVVGEARLNGDRFDMNYTFSVGGNQGAAGGDFKMSGSAEGRKIGQCNETRPM
jgi:hypothetical protein